MIKWWRKNSFEDLKPFDVLEVEQVLERYQNTLKTFPQYEKHAEEGNFFLGIKSKNLDDPEVKYFHEKFNHPNCDLLADPRPKICMVYREGRNFDKKLFHTKENLKFSGGTSNYNGRDGQIRGGWATPTIEGFHINPVREKILTGKWVFLTIPYQLLYNFINTTNNGVPIQIPKKFVKEVEDTVGWDDINKVKKVVDKFDKIYPDWSHDFPINGYFQMKKDGLLFPAVWWNYFLNCGHSFHRMIMTSFNKMDFPYITPIPVTKNNIWYTCSMKDSFLFNNEKHYLTAKINLNDNLVTYSFTKDKRWALKKNKQVLI